MVTALRNCAGALSDMTEVGVSGPFGGHVDKPGVKVEKEVGASPLEEEKPKEEKAPVVKKAVEEEKPDVEKEPSNVKAVTKEKRKAKKRDNKAKARQASQSPKKESQSQKEEDRPDRGEALRSSGSKRPAEDRERSRTPKRSRETREETRKKDRREGKKREEDINREVRRDPARFGLEHVPIRGSAGRSQQGDVIPAGARRPAEPLGPPPERYEGSQRGNYDRIYRDRQTGQKPPRWKGYSHYTRGVEYWRGKKRGR